MLKVGLFAPYCRSEATLAATQFADWLVRVGIDVSYLVEGGVERGIHATWDESVTRHRSPASTYRWAYGATHLCWFSPNGKVFRESKVVASASQRQYTRQLYFPTWNNWDLKSTEFLEMVDRIVCLSRDMHLWLKEREPVNFLQGERTWGNLISPDIALKPRHGFRHEGEVRLLAVIPRTVPEDMGPSILDVFDFLLATHEELRLTLLLESSWPRSYRRRVVRLNRCYDDRVKVLTSLPYYSWGRHICDQDWVYICNTRHCYGSLLSAIGMNCVPVVAHDVPPIGGHIQDKINGRLIPCELGNEGYPVAKVRPEAIAETLDSVLRDDSLNLKSLQIQSRVVIDRRQSSFESMILKEFVG